MKRTTLILEDGCMRAVRVLARQQHRTMSAVVNELLSEGVQRRKARAGARTPALPSFSMGRPHVHLGDRNALEALMDS